jgi:hypothetical protein
MVVIKKLIKNQIKEIDSLSLDVHNCIHNNHRLISCFIGGYI